MQEHKWNVAAEFQHLDPSEHLSLYESVSDQSAVACINLSGDINIGMMIRTAAQLEFFFSFLCILVYIGLFWFI